MPENTDEIVIEKCQEKTEPVPEEKTEPITEEKTEPASEEKTESTTDIISEIKTEPSSEDKTESFSEEEKEDKFDRIEYELNSLSNTLSKIAEDLDSRKKEFIVVNKKKDIMRTLDEVVSEMDISLKTLNSCILDLNELYVYYEHLPVLPLRDDLRKISGEISTIRCDIVKIKEKTNRERFLNINSSNVAKYFNMR